MSNFTTTINIGLTFVVKNTAPRGKTLTIFNTQIPSGGTLDLIKIGGVSEDDVRASILKGEVGYKLSIGYLTVVKSTLSFTGTDSSYTTFLSSVGINASTGTEINSVPNLAALGQVNDSDEVNGGTRFVQSVLSFFYLDQTSTLTVDGSTVLATRSGVGRWLRQLDGNPTRNNQTTWYLDPQNSSGTASDENSGLGSTTPLLTNKELGMRLRGHLNRGIGSFSTSNQNPAITVNLLSNVTNAADILSVSGFQAPSGAQGAGITGAPYPGPSYNPVFRIQGQRITSSFTDPNTSSTTALTLTAAATQPQTITTTISAGSDGYALPQATISLASTTNLPTQGNIIINTGTGSAGDPYVNNVVSYTGVSGLALTGCTGGSGTMHVGNAVGMPVPTIIQVSNFNFTPYIGQMVQVLTSSVSASIASTGMIVKAPYTGVAWLAPLTNLTVNAQTVLSQAQQPSLGSTISIYTTTSWAPPAMVGVVPETTIEFQDITFPSGQDTVATNAQSYMFLGCIVQRAIRAALASPSNSLMSFSGGGAIFALPAAGHSPLQWAHTGGEVRFYGFGFINVDLRAREFASNVGVAACVMVGCQVCTGGPNDINRPGGHFGVGGAGNYGLGVFDWPVADLLGQQVPETNTRGSTGCAIHVGHKAHVQISAPFFGTCAGAGTLSVRVNEGGFLQFSEQITSGTPGQPSAPTPQYIFNSLWCAGAAGAYQIDRQTTHFVYTDLVAALGGTSKTPTLAGGSWSQWENTFSRNIVSLLTGASIQSMQV